MKEKQWNPGNHEVWRYPGEGGGVWVLPEAALSDFVHPGYHCGLSDDDVGLHHAHTGAQVSGFEFHILNVLMTVF